MNRRTPELAEQLLLIERELRALGAWESLPPEPQALASSEPFCVDTLSFEQWLQWIFLPRMKMILESGAALPAVSGILVMAEMVYRDCLRPVSSLLEALQRFDSLISCGEG